MAISYQDIGQICATFHATGSMQEGNVCKLSSNDTVSACSADGAFHGVLLHGDGTLHCVQVCGYVTVPYTGTAPAVGYTALAANGAGGVKTLSGARERLVVHVDSSAKTVGFFL